MSQTPAGARTRASLAGSRFEDVRWVERTGSTNADVLGLIRAGEPEGIVVVADHQTAGRGRLGRTWVAPPGACLLLTVLLRPASALAGATTMATACAAAAAVEELAGREPRLKWPNDLVWPGDGSAPDRKLAGILAEVDWPAASSAAGGWVDPGDRERVAVAVGIGVNVRWPEPPPPELGDLAVTVEEISGRVVDREDLLLSFLRHLDRRYTRLVGNGGRAEVMEEWRARSATLGHRVRVDLGREDVEGTAVDVTDDGHLVVRGDDGEHRTLAVGDVVHLRRIVASTDEPPRATSD